MDKDIISWVVGLVTLWAAMFVTAAYIKARASRQGKEKTDSTDNRDRGGDC